MRSRRASAFCAFEPSLYDINELDGDQEGACLERQVVRHPLQEQSGDEEDESQQDDGKGAGVKSLRASRMASMIPGCRYTRRSRAM